MTMQPLAMASVGEVRQEISLIFGMMGFDDVVAPAQKALDGVVSLYGGRWPGFEACETPYHNIEHVMLVTMAMLRLLHGAKLAGHAMTSREAMLCVVAALFHDSGLIRGKDDPESHGAQLTAVHVKRSGERVDEWLRGQGVSAEERTFAVALLHCTELEVPASSVGFKGESQRYLGALLKAADLAGQVADLAYAEKLPLLAEEMAIAHAKGFEGKGRLILNTPGFCRMVLDRLVMVDGRSLLNHSRAHFKARFQIDADLYTAQIERQILFLEGLTKNGLKPYWDHLEKGEENGLSLP